MKWFFSFLKKYWLRMVSGLILVTILAATALASPYISKLKSKIPGYYRS